MAQPAPATRPQQMWNSVLNSRNQSGIRGVYWEKKRGFWYAEIVANGERHWFGCFKTKEEAAVVYAKAARRLHGRFARSTSGTA